MKIQESFSMILFICYEPLDNIRIFPIVLCPFIVVSKFSSNLNIMCIKCFDCALTWFFVLRHYIQKSLYSLWAIWVHYSMLIMHAFEFITDNNCQNQFIRCISKILSQFWFHKRIQCIYFLTKNRVLMMQLQLGHLHLVQFMH